MTPAYWPLETYPFPFLEPFPPIESYEPWDRGGDMMHSPQGESSPPQSRHFYEVGLMSLSGPIPF